MPKAPARKASSTSKPSTKKSFPYPQSSSEKKKKKKDSKPPPSSSSKPAKPPKKEPTTPAAKDPKASHLYTSDNPSTTLPGTGFKDAPTAHHTLSLISPRSLTYQHQTITTLLHRAKAHAHRTPAMDAAIAVFHTWLQHTYPAAKAAQRDFKPLLSKKVVGGLLERMRKVKEEGVDTSFAEVYVGLEKRKRLANTLVEEGEPAGEDWEGRRVRRLAELVPEGGEEMGEEELWEGEEAEGGPTVKHLKLIAWAWSPASERKLLGRVGKS